MGGLEGMFILEKIGDFELKRWIFEQKIKGGSKIVYRNLQNFLLYLKVI